jgi:dienelactone hydrolase
MLKLFSFYYFFLYALNISAQVSHLWGNLHKGQFDVGFKVIGIFDSTRYEGIYPLQISIWYPSEKNNASSYLTYKDYLLLTANEKSLTPITEEIAEGAIADFKSFVTSNGVAGKAFDIWMSEKMEGVINAKPINEEFPLILLAQGNFQTAYNQAILAEYLASHGYIVATSPSPTRILGPIKDNNLVLKFAETQYHDLLLTYNQLSNDLSVDTNKIGLIGYSFGARGAFLFLLNHDAVFVSLDGGIANKQGKDWLDSVSFSVGEIKTPILHFFQEVDTLVQPDFDLLRSLTSSERYLVKVDSIYHIQFSSLGFISALIPGFNIGISGPGLQMKCEAIYRFILAYLDHYLKNNNIHKGISFNPEPYLTKDMILYKLSD